MVTRIKMDIHRAATRQSDIHVVATRWSVMVNVNLNERREPGEIPLSGNRQRKGRRVRPQPSSTINQCRQVPPKTHPTPAPNGNGDGGTCICTCHLVSGAGWM